jgi:hypothetical protein
MNELGATGRAIALEVRTAWLAALRADLRRAVRNILRVVWIRREWLKRSMPKFDYVQVEALFRLGIFSLFHYHVTRSALEEDPASQKDAHIGCRRKSVF